ncbi:hypothetical protein Tco_1326326 [Tanacetum coccineum]
MHPGRFHKGSSGCLFWIDVIMVLYGSWMLRSVGRDDLMMRRFYEEEWRTWNEKELIGNLKPWTLLATINDVLCWMLFVSKMLLDLVSQEFNAQAPQLIEELFKNYVQSNIIQVHPTTTTSTETTSSADLQQQLYFKMKRRGERGVWLGRGELEQPVGRVGCRLGCNADLERIGKMVERNGGDAGGSGEERGMRREYMEADEDGRGCVWWGIVFWYRWKWRGRGVNVVGFHRSTEWCRCGGWLKKVWYGMRSWDGRMGTCGEVGGRERKSRREVLRNTEGMRNTVWRENVAKREKRGGGSGGGGRRGRGGYEGVPRGRRRGGGEDGRGVGQGGGGLERNGSRKNSEEWGLEGVGGARRGGVYDESVEGGEGAGGGWRLGEMRFVELWVEGEWERGKLLQMCCEGGGTWLSFEECEIGRKIEGGRWDGKEGGDRWEKEEEVVELEAVSGRGKQEDMVCGWGEKGGGGKREVGRMRVGEGSWPDESLEIAMGKGEERESRCFEEVEVVMVRRGEAGEWSGVVYGRLEMAEGYGRSLGRWGNGWGVEGEGGDEKTGGKRHRSDCDSLREQVVCVGKRKGWGAVGKMGIAGVVGDCEGGRNSEGGRESCWDLEVAVGLDRGVEREYGWNIDEYRDGGSRGGERECVEGWLRKKAAGGEGRDRVGGRGGGGIGLERWGRLEEGFEGGVLCAMRRWDSSQGDEGEMGKGGEFVE